MVQKGKKACISTDLNTYLHSIPESVETDHPTTRFWKKPGQRRRPLESFSSFVFHPSTYRTVEIVLKEDLTRNYCILRSSTTNYNCSV